MVTKQLLNHFEKNNLMFMLNILQYKIFLNGKPYIEYEYMQTLK